MYPSKNYKKLTANAWGATLTINRKKKHVLHTFPKDSKVFWIIDDRKEQEILMKANSRQVLAFKCQD